MIALLWAAGKDKVHRDSKFPAELHGANRISKHNQEESRL